jgi:hypothetical protein
VVFRRSKENCSCSGVVGKVVVVLGGVRNAAACSLEVKKGRSCFRRS